jgi:hypothetical protein
MKNKIAVVLALAMVALFVIAASVSTFDSVRVNTVYAPTNTANFTIVTNDVVLNTLYTNRGQQSWIGFGVSLFSTNSGGGAVGIVVDQNADNTYEATIVQETSQVTGTGANSTSRRMIGTWLQPGARFYITNGSSSPGTAAVVGSSTQWVFQ